MIAAQPIHGPNPAFVTKELDLEEMEHANFDPEVAAAYHEDGLEEADLGYWAGGDYGMGHDPPAGARAQPRTAKLARAAQCSTVDLTAADFAVLRLGRDLRPRAFT